MSSAKLPYSWKPVTEDTDCRECHYTIQAGDPEGMFLIRGEWFCSNPCGERWEATPPTRYSHQFLIAVTVETTTADPHAVPISELHSALAGRTNDIYSHDRREAFGHNDTEEI